MVFLDQRFQKGWVSAISLNRGPVIVVFCGVMKTRASDREQAEIRKNLICLELLGFASDIAESKSRSNPRIMLWTPVNSLTAAHSMKEA